MKKIDFNSFAKQIHKNAKAKGFYDKPRNIGELFMLIVSEMGEATEAHRKGRTANLQLFEDQYRKNRDLFIDLFAVDIKDTVEDEIADVVIRLLDYCAFIGEEISEGKIADLTPKEVPENIGEAIFEMVGTLRWIYVASDPITRSDEIHGFLSMMLAFCEKNSIDLCRHMELKTNYNKTRERLHGKNY